MRARGDGLCPAEVAEPVTAASQSTGCLLVGIDPGRSLAGLDGPLDGRCGSAAAPANR